MNIYLDKRYIELMVDIWVAFTCLFYETACNRYDISTFICI